MGSIWNFWFIFGLIIFAVDAAVLIKQFILRTLCTETTQGVIVPGNFAARESAMMLTFTVDYEDYRLPFGYSNKISAGDTVTVAYNPVKITRHSCYIVEDVPNLRRMAVICTIAGIVFILLGYGVSIGLFTENIYL